MNQPIVKDDSHSDYQGFQEQARALMAEGVWTNRFADGQDHISNCGADLNWQWGVAAGPAQDQLAAHDDAHDGIIHVPDDGAVVDQEEVGDVAEAFEGFVFIGADRFVAEVAAGGHDGEAEPGEEQVMERRVGEHHAEVGVAGGDGHRQWLIARRRLAPPEQDDGGFGGAEEALFEGRDFARGLDAGQRREHEGEGLFFAVF